MAVTIKFKTVFNLDRKVISRNWKKINRNPITNAGVIVMRNARQSIRSGNISKKSGRRIPSKPGRPPKSWGGRGTTPPFKQIFSVPNFTQTTVTIGMVGFSREAIPGVHERGGTLKRRVFVETGEQRRTKKGRFGRKIRKPVIKTIRLPARPFMGPALDKAIRQGKLPSMWLNSIQKAGIGVA